ncbi:MAG: hypothetical protein Q9224_007293 [Gallowayella concinna]
MPNANRNCRDYRVEVGGRKSPACVVEEKILLRMVDWAIAEVKYKAKILKQIDCIEALDGVWKSDTIINEELRTALDVAVWSLEDVPEVKSASAHTSPDNIEDCYSSEWLPAEFDLLPDSDKIVMKSYINNLQPKFHSDLYFIIPKINAKVIPLWDRVLSRVICPPMPPRVSDLSNSDMGFGEAIFDGPEQEKGEDDNDYWRRLDEWEESDDRVDNRTFIEPEPGEYQTTAEGLQGK